MKKILFGITILALSLHTYAQQIPAVSAEELIRYTSSKDTLYIINFWATWCPPCREEMPSMELLARRHAQDIAFLAVSVDEVLIAFEPLETPLMTMPLRF